MQAPQVPEKAQPCPGYALTAAELPPRSPPAAPACCYRVLPSLQRPESTQVIASKQPETPSLCNAGGGEGAACLPHQQPAPAQPADTALPPAALAQHLCRAWEGHAQGQHVPETCGTPGMQQWGWGKAELPSSRFPPHQCLPGPCQALLGAKVQPGRAERYWGKTPWEGRAASPGAVVPTPSQHSGMVRRRVDEGARAG